MGTCQWSACLRAEHVIILIGLFLARDDNKDKEGGKGEVHSTRAKLADGDHDGGAESKANGESGRDSQDPSTSVSQHARMRAERSITYRWSFREGTWRGGARGPTWWCSRA